jgi:hypothetical protein
VYSALPVVESARFLLRSLVDDWFFDEIVRLFETLALNKSTTATMQWNRWQLLCSDYECIFTRECEDDDGARGFTYRCCGILQMRVCSGLNIPCRQHVARSMVKGERKPYFVQVQLSVHIHTSVFIHYAMILKRMLYVNMAA